MAKLLRKMAILAAVEATRGTDALPTGAANALLVSGVTLTPIEGSEIERDNIKPYFGASGTVLVTEYSKIAFSVEVAGVAVPGSAPGYAALFQGCAMAMTTNDGVSVSFAPVTDGIPSLTIYGNVDGVQHIMRDAHGSVKAAIDAKGIPKWHFEFTGLFTPATDTPLPAAVYTSFMTPLGVNKINTTLMIDGVGIAASAFAFDCGNTVVKRDLMTIDSVEITGRKSTGSVTLENTAVAVKDWVMLGRLGARIALSLQHGPDAFNVVEFHAPIAQVGKPTFGDSDGVQMVTLPLTFIPSPAGNDEWSIVVR